MNTKRWSLIILIGFMIILIWIGGMVIVIDPYFHYHSPIKGLAYEIDKYDYINNGIIRNFDYNAIITGTSLTECTSTDEIDQLFDVDSVRLTFLGEGFKRISDNLDIAFTEKSDIRTIIWGLDTMMFISDKDYFNHEASYATYLYDDNVWNDVKYLYNIDILIQDIFPEINRTLRGEGPNSFDREEWQYDIGGKERVLSNYIRPKKNILTISDNDTKGYVERLDQSLNQNVLPLIENHPDTTFYIFFPPYSICFWDSLNQNGTDALKRRIVLEQYAIESLLPYNNVKLYSFFNNFDLITDLSHYRDDCHYTPEINSQILVWMSNDDYRLTWDNYMEYIHKITEFYTSYDYETIFE